MTRDEIIRMLHPSGATMSETLLARTAEAVLPGLCWLMVELFQPEEKNWNVETRGIYRAEVQEWNPETAGIAQLTNLQGQVLTVMKKVCFVGQNHTFTGMVRGAPAHPLMRQMPGIVFLDDDSFDRCWVRRASPKETLDFLVGDELRGSSDAQS